MLNFRSIPLTFSETASLAGDGNRSRALRASADRWAMSDLSFARRRRSRMLKNGIDVWQRSCREVLAPDNANDELRVRLHLRVVNHVGATAALRKCAQAIAGGRQRPSQLPGK